MTNYISSKEMSRLSGVPLRTIQNLTKHKALQTLGGDHPPGKGTSLLYLATELEILTTLSPILIRGLPVKEAKSLIDEFRPVVLITERLGFSTVEQALELRRLAKAEFDKGAKRKDLRDQASDTLKKLKPKWPNIKFGARDHELLGAWMILHQKANEPTDLLFIFRRDDGGWMFLPSVDRATAADVLANVRSGYVIVPHNLRNTSDKPKPSRSKK